MPLTYSLNRTGGLMLVYDDETYHLNSTKSGAETWRCSKYKMYGCRARVCIKLVKGCKQVQVAEIPHTHVDKRKTYKPKEKPIKLEKQDDGPEILLL